MMTLTGGHNVEYHPLFNLPPIFYGNMTGEYKQGLKFECAKYNNCKNKKSHIEYFKPCVIGQLSH